MRKLKRRKVHRDWLEGQLFKYERRIQRLAEEAYRFRQAIEILDAQEAARNRSKEGLGTEIVEAAVQTKVEENNDAIRGNEAGEGTRIEGDNAGEAGGSVRSSVQTNVGEVDSQPQLDNMESNP